MLKLLAIQMICTAVKACNPDLGNCVKMIVSIYRLYNAYHGLILLANDSCWGDSKTRALLHLLLVLDLLLVICIVPCLIAGVGVFLAGAVAIRGEERGIEVFVKKA